MKTFCAICLLTATASAAPFKLTSKDFKEGGAIPDKDTFNSFGCSGQNESPELTWTDPPAGTKSFALMVHDPDAPTGSGWWHWVVYNIPADTKSIPEGAGKADGKAMPKGAVQGNTDFGTPGYGGPCPPAGSGAHHYNFTLFALKVDKLDIPANATAAFVGFNVMANSLGKAKLTGTYTRKKDAAPAPAK
jgi:Raf kinase inhibitor-like YbhB/YbcL family protein